jgi:hypothetical protein
MTTDEFNAPLDALLREHWGKMTVREIAALAKRPFSSTARRAGLIGLTKAGSKTLPPRGIAFDQVAWAKANAATDREAAMILALKGRDVRALGWR